MNILINIYTVLVTFFYTLSLINNVYEHKIQPLNMIIHGSLIIYGVVILVVNI